MPWLMHRDQGEFGSTVYESNNPVIHPLSYKSCTKTTYGQIEIQIPEKYVIVIAKMKRSVMELHIVKSIISNGIP